MWIRYRSKMSATNANKNNFQVRPPFFSLIYLHFIILYIIFYKLFVKKLNWIEKSTKN